MRFALCRIVRLEDFDEQVVRNAIREVFAHEVAKAPGFPTGREHRKQWEIALAVLSLRRGGVLRGDAEVLGIGAGSEATLFWLTNQVCRVWATDLYADPGKWVRDAPPTMLTNPGSAWDGSWNHRRLVVQHMDACQLAHEDEMFDGIFSSGSIEHFGSLQRIGVAMDEAYRVLKPGGTASFSTEFLIRGDPLAFETDLVMFTPDLIDGVLVGDRDWALVNPIDYTLTDATIATEISAEEYHAREQRGESVHPHCVLRVGSNLITSVHFALRKSERPRKLRPRESARLGTLPAVSTPPSESTLKRVARRLARPVLSPVDGRVADINRRIESAAEAYARSASETSSYVGVELRRIHDLLADFGETSFQEVYKSRLALAVELPLEKLDEPLAQAINYATSHEGFYAQAGLWFNPPVSVALWAGNASAIQVTERIVEVPFAMAALSRLEPGARILDIGSAESTFPLSAASLGYRVTAIDLRPLAYSHPNLESHATRLEDWDAPSEPFGAVFLVSTIEHVGLGAYGEDRYGDPEHGAGADLAFLQRARALLSPDGLLVLTVPYGTRGRTDLERIYDEASLTALLDEWEILDRRIAVRRDALVWEAVNDVEPGARGVVMVVASPRAGH